MEKKLVEHLVNSAVVTRRDIQRCVLRAAMSEKSVVDEMLERLPLDQAELAQAMADYWGLSFSDAPTIETQPFALSTIPGDLARRYGVLPMNSEAGDEAVTLAVYDVEKAQPVIEKVREKTGVSPTLVLTLRETLEREIHRHYGTNEAMATPAEPVTSAATSGDSAPGLGVMRPIRSTGKAGNERREESATEALDPPTRQIELTTDNPFMDLVAATAKNAPSFSEPAEPPTETLQAEEDKGEDFFDGFDERPRSRPRQRTQSQSRQETKAKAVDEFQGALDAFDAELDAAEEEVSELRPSTVDWGAADTGHPFGRPSSSGSGPRALDDYDVEGSGIFPLEGGRGVFDLGEEDTGRELTLADVVDRQRRLIQKLEREIEYQKGILQTMAEMLIEARVLSRRKLKNRLKALKEEQKNR